MHVSRLGQRMLVYRNGSPSQSAVETGVLLFRSSIKRLLILYYLLAYDKVIRHGRISPSFPGPFMIAFTIAFMTYIVRFALSLRRKVGKRWLKQCYYVVYDNKRLYVQGYTSWHDP